MITLRPHQERAVEAVLAHWRAGGGNPLISHCVGSGKSLTLAEIGKRILTDYPGTSVLCLTMTKELIEQNAEAARMLWPAAPAGINCATLKRRDTKQEFLFAHPLSVYRNAKALGPRHVIMIDEVQNVSRDQMRSVYGKVISALRELVPDLRLLGASGTIWRLDSGRLTDEWKGVPSMWDRCVDEYTIPDGIRDGYLVEPITRKPSTTLDVSGVRTRGGEFIEKDLQAAVDHSDVNSAIVDEIIAQSRDRNSCIVFATGIEHAKHLHEQFKAKHQSSVLVTSEDNDERDQAIAYYKRGAAKFMVNIGIATTGFNHPSTDCIALVRPTQSSGLMIQMIGRGLRAHIGKQDCLVLDFAGNVSRLGCIDEIDGKKTPGLGGKAPTKTCPECATVVSASTLTCKQCGHEWPAPKPDIAPEVQVAPILSSQADVEFLDVQRLSYAIHQRTDADGNNIGQPSLRIDYFINYGLTVREWLGFDSQKPGAKGFYQRIWRARANSDVVPESTAEAYQLARTHLRRPGRIRVRKKEKFYEVLGVDLSVTPTREKSLTPAV